METQSLQQDRYIVGVYSSETIYRLVWKMLKHLENIEVKPISQASPRNNHYLPADVQLLVYEIGKKNAEQIDPSLAYFLKEQKKIPVITVTTQPSYSVAVQYLKSGVCDYINLMQEQSKLYNSIQSFLKQWKKQRKQKYFIDYSRRTYDFSRIIGKSVAINRTIDLLKKVIATENITVLLIGETGTGKELISKTIHYNGNNREHPFVEIACSAIPDTLLESELFGYEKGAFTDAKERKIGLFELAGKGTIFLDDINDINPLIQTKLLKVLEEKKMRRLGGVEEIPVHARIIAATSVDLEKKVESGEFRKDLYYRLKIVPIVLPPLRERKDDIPLLAEYFLNKFSEEYQKDVREFTPEAMQLLTDYHWEGNVRELKHSVERAVLLTEKPYINDADLEPYVNFSTEFNNNGDSDSDNLSIKLPTSEDISLNRVEMYVTREILQRVRGNKLHAARILNISRPKLDRIINRDPNFFYATFGKLGRNNN